MATHSSILAWRVLWTEEPGGLQSIRVSKSWLSKSWTRLKRLNTIFLYHQPHFCRHPSYIICKTEQLYRDQGIKSMNPSQKFNNNLGKHVLFNSQGNMLVYMAYFFLTHFCELNQSLINSLSKQRVSRRTLGHCFHM